jgi:hypothetical protein
VLSPIDRRARSSALVTIIQCHGVVCCSAAGQIVGELERQRHAHPANRAVSLPAALDKRVRWSSAASSSVGATTMSALPTLSTCAPWPPDTDASLVCSGCGIAPADGDSDRLLMTYTELTSFALQHVRRILRTGNETTRGESRKARRGIHAAQPRRYSVTKTQTYTQDIHTAPPHTHTLTHHGLDPKATMYGCTTVRRRNSVLSSETRKSVSDAGSSDPSIRDLLEAPAVALPSTRRTSHTDCFRQLLNVTPARVVADPPAIRGNLKRAKVRTDAQSSVLPRVHWAAAAAPAASGFPPP